VFGGGVIPEDDIPGLKAAGICEVFTPGTSTEDIVKWVQANVPPRA
jgi:methylmalonyl-CoA mutase C-terminal domain/subunit